MTEAFIGLSVLATLSDPLNAKIRGVVTDVEAGQLTLNQVTWLSNSYRQDTLLVSGSNIQDIEIEPDLVPSTPAPAAKAKPERSNIDPAIVGYSKTENHIGSIPQNAETPQTTSIKPDAPLPFKVPSTWALLPKPPVGSRGAVVPTPVKTSPNRGSPLGPVPAPASATLTEPFNDMTLNGLPPKPPAPSNFDTNADLKGQSVDAGETASQKFSKRGSRGAARNRRSDGKVFTPNKHSQDSEDHLNASPVQQRRNTTGKKNGWRQTPILEEPAMANIRLPRAQQSQTIPAPTLTPGPLRQTKPSPEPTKKRVRRYKDSEDQNGWATEEATDIQEMGDFDFEENHKKFDKRKVFEDIRRDDTTADEARLVYYNKLPSARPGTAGGKNLHYTESVLESTVKKVAIHSSGDSESDLEEIRVSSGRSLSRASTRRNIPSRKGSVLASTSFEAIVSPKIRPDSSLSFLKASTTSLPKSTFHIESSHRVCPCVTPLQMLELEQLATAEFGLTEDMINENAARGIAETALRLASSNEPRHTASPLIVILAGNNRTGARAIASARHLRNHNSRVVPCILGLEREEDLLDSVRHQLTIFRNNGGQAIKQDGLVRRLRQLQTPPDLIVDALLGMHISFEDLRTDDQAAYFQLVCWANGSDAPTLALDVPSGIDASTGSATAHDGTDLVVLAQQILCLGAPKTGLLIAMEGLMMEGKGVEGEEEVRLMVADIGIGSGTWRKFGTKRRRGVEFGEDWIARLSYVEGG